MWRTIRDITLASVAFTGLVAIAASNTTGFGERELEEVYSFSCCDSPMAVYKKNMRFAADQYIIQSKEFPREAVRDGTLVTDSGEYVTVKPRGFWNEPLYIVEQ